MQAMILAAGFGTRLLPYTKIRPKPLFPLLNEPLLLLTIKRLQNAGFDHIIVNCHHLKEQIVEALTGLQGVVVQEEDTILGTGGGLRMALASMRDDEPLLITNGDIYHSVDYLELYRSHGAGDTVVTMAMHDYPRFNNVGVRGGLVSSFGVEGKKGCLAFTGLHVLDPPVLEVIPQTGKSCIIDRYRKLLSDGERIQAKEVSGCSWTDMGTVEDYLALHGQLLTGEISLWSEFSTSFEGTVLCQDKTVKPIFDDWACVGNVLLPEELHLTRCVVWDNARLETGKTYSDCLLV